jgi:hypothetical protein
VGWLNLKFTGTVESAEDFKARFVRGPQGGDAVTVNQGLNLDINAGYVWLDQLSGARIRTVTLRGNVYVQGYTIPSDVAGVVVASGANIRFEYLSVGSSSPFTFAGAATFTIGTLLLNGNVTWPITLNLSQLVAASGAPKP